MDIDEIKEVVGADGGEEGEAQNSDAPAGSILDAIREKNRELAKTRTKVMDIPGYDGILAAEYRQIPYEAMSKLLNRAAKSKDATAELNAMTDLLVQSCVQILVRTEDGKLTPMHEAVEGFGGDPVRYDTRLAQAAEVEGERARLICQNVFNNDLALVAHNNDLVEWMRTNDSEEDRDF